MKLISKSNRFLWTLAIILLSNAVVRGEDRRSLSSDRSGKKSPRLHDQSAINIDAFIARVHSSQDVRPAETCDDATFLRRVSLDLVGHIPTVHQWQQFLKHRDRQVVVEALLNSPEHTEYWSRLWSELWIGRHPGRHDAYQFRSWVRDRLAAETPMDDIVTALVSSEGVSSLNGACNFAIANRDGHVLRVGRAFLGTQLDCAQCHDHPFDRWTQEDYEGMNRFFSVVQFKQVSGGIRVDDRAGSKNSKQPLPRFLSGHQPKSSAWRSELSFLITKSRPFDRAIVNRVWSWLCGRGIVEPVDHVQSGSDDDLYPMLDKLGREFRESNFDLRQLIKKIVLSKAYQRSSVADEGATDNEWFATRSPRLMRPDQWHRSVLLAVGQEDFIDSRALDRHLSEIDAAGSPSISNDPFDRALTTQTLIEQLASRSLGTLGRKSSESKASYRMDAMSNEKWVEYVLGRSLSQREADLYRDVDRKDLRFAVLHSHEFHWVD